MDMFPVEKNGCWYRATPSEYAQWCPDGTLMICPASVAGLNTYVYQESSFSSRVGYLMNHVWISSIADYNDGWLSQVSTITDAFLGKLKNDVGTRFTWSDLLADNVSGQVVANRDPKTGAVFAQKAEELKAEMLETTCGFRAIFLRLSC